MDGDQLTATGSESPHMDRSGRTILPKGNAAIIPERPLIPPARLTWKCALGVLAAILILTTIGAWIYRLELSRLTATWLLDRSGIGPTSLTVGAIDFGGIHARDISLFGGAVRVEALTLSYDPRQLAAGVVNRATLIKPRITVGMTEQGPRIGGFSLGGSGSSGASSFMDGIRINAIRLVDAQVALTGSAEPFEATFSTDLVVAGSDISGSALAAEVELKLPGATRAVHFVVPSFALSLADGGARLRFTQVAIQPRDLPWTMDALDGEISSLPGRLAARVTSGRMRNTATPALISPVDLTAEATMTGSRIDFALRGGVQPPSGAGEMRMGATGHHDQDTGKGQSSVTVGPVIFKSTGPRPQDLFPILTGTLPDLSGSAGLSGSIAWDGSTISSALIFRLADGVYEPKGLRLSAIRGDIAIAELWPLSTGVKQVVRSTVEAGGLPPIQTTLVFQLLPKPALRVDAIRLEFLGGGVSTSPFIIDPGRPVVDTTIALQQVDLAAFFQLIGVSGLSGSGRLDGNIPLTVRAGTVIIRDGRLVATEPGIIRLDSGTLPRQITDAGESMTMVLQALADFHYDSMTIDLAGEAAGNAGLFNALN